MILIKSLKIAIVATCMMFSHSLPAAETDNDKRPIRISVISDYSPYSMSLPNGAPTGLYVDFWNLWSETNNIPIEFHPADYAENINSLKNGTTDLHGGLFVNEERQSWAEFSIPIHHVSSGFFFDAELKEIPEIASLSNRVVGVGKGTFQEAYLRKNYPKFTIKTFLEMKNTINALLNQDIDAIFTEIPYMDAQLGKLGLRGVFKVSEENQISNQVKALVPHGNSQLIEKLNKGIRNIPISALIKLEKKWLPEIKPFFEEIDYSQVPTLNLKQLKWLKQNQQFNIGIDNHSEPFEYLNENGDFSGISSDYIKLLQSKLELDVVEKKEYEWNQLLEMIQNGTIDILPAVVKTRERAKHFNFSDPYVSFPMVIVTRKDRLFIQDINGLRNHQVGIVEGYFIEELLIKDHPEIQLIGMSSVKAGLAKVNDGNLDAFIANLAVVTHELNHSNLNLIRIASTTPYDLNLSIGVRKGLEDLVPIINQALATISQEEHSAIANRWLALNVEFGTSVKTYLLWSAPIVVFLSLIILYVIRSNRRLQFEITGRKEVESSLERARLTAVSANKAKDNFLADISHEIRNPMNAVIGMSYLLEQSDLDDTQNQYIQILNSSANSLLSLIDDLLDLSKIESGMMTLENIEFDLQRLLNEIEQQILIRINTDKLSLAIKYSPSVPRLVLGDPLRLKQILVNLLNNAAKFTVEGEITLYVNVSKQKDTGGLLQFTVSDTGIGMTSEQKQRLFRNYSQADTSTTRKFGGTGLGLSISKKLCQVMGGEIWVESDIGKGSHFHFTVYFEKVTGSELKVSDQLVESDFAEYSNLVGKTILLVDDSENNLMFASELFSNAGVEVFTAMNGLQAIDELGKHQIDVVLMDLQMPVMDGYTATQNIRKNPEYKALPIIAMSANVLTRDVQKVMDSGMNGHIAKPLKVDKLLMVVNELFSTD